MHMMRWCGLSIFLVCANVHAAVTITIEQSGPNVVATASGSLDLSGTISSSTVPLWSSFDYNSPADYYYVVGAPPLPGNVSGGLYTTNWNVQQPLHSVVVSLPPDSSSGDVVGVSDDGGAFVHAPSGYVSGTPIAATAIWNGRTLADLGLTPGTYTFAFPGDSIVFVVNDPTADLSVVKTVLGGGTAEAGGPVIFEITVTNNGPAAETFDDWTVTDALPPGLSFLTSAGPVSCSPEINNSVQCAATDASGDLASGASVTFQIVATVAPDAASPLTNSALVTGATDNNAANDTSNLQFAVERRFDLALAVVDAPDPVLAGSGAGNLTHTFTLSRVGGPSDAPGVAVDIVPSLPAGVTIDSAVPSVGSWAGTTWTVGDVPASTTGDIGTLTITLTVDATATDCTDCVSATGTISTTSGTDTNPANNTAVNPTSIETAASVASGFLTTVAFTNGYNGTVGVTISCNNGLPLTQSKDISAASGVNFTVTSLDFIAPDTECDISVDVESGYSASVLANGVDTGGSCAFSGTPVADESAAFAQDRANTCEITAAPIPSQFVVTKDWVTYDDGNTEQTGSLRIWCTPASIDTGNQFGTVEDTFDLDGDGTFYLDFYPAPGGATCYADEDVDSSAIESSSTCAGGVPFAVGDTVKTCAITNTVFFEGIPTLSQYGLALLVLLMLGVGFVGIRRFA